MPVFNVHIPRGRFSLEHKHKLANALSQASVQGLGISECDRFIMLSEHGSEELFLFPAFSNVQHELASSLIIIVLMEADLSPEDRRQLVPSITQLLVSEVGISSDDVFIKLLPTQGESASNLARIWPEFGHGIEYFIDRRFWVSGGQAIHSSAAPQPQRPLTQVQP